MALIAPDMDAAQRPLLHLVDDVPAAHARPGALERTVTWMRYHPRFLAGMMACTAVSCLLQAITVQ